MVYRGTSSQSIGLCFNDKYPGIRRACVLDLTGGVMSILLSIFLIMIEFFSAYLDDDDVSYVHVMAMSLAIMFVKADT